MLWLREKARLMVLNSLSIFPIKAKGIAHIYLHSVTDHEIGTFERLLDALLAEGEIIALEEWIRRFNIGDNRPAFTISFDDGYRDIYLNARPALERRGLSATVFVLAGFLGLSGQKLQTFTKENIRWNELRSPLNAEDVQRMSDIGFEIGSHGFTHKPFNMLTNSEMLWELTESKRILEKLIRKEVRYFAWPLGKLPDCENKAGSIAQHAGYQNSFSASASRSGTLHSRVLPRRNVELRWGLHVCRFLSLNPAFRLPFV
jgi:peptidoglycan/xylan/chitin deacetylase (PgdA/CDA1 family)